MSAQTQTVGALSRLLLIIQLSASIVGNSIHFAERCRNKLEHLIIVRRQKQKDEKTNCKNRVG